MSMVRPFGILCVLVALMAFSMTPTRAGDPMPEPKPLPLLIYEFDPATTGAVTIADEARLEVSNFGCWDSDMALVNADAVDRVASVQVRVVDRDGVLQAAISLAGSVLVPAATTLPLQTSGCDHALGLAFPDLTKFRAHRSLTVH